MRVHTIAVVLILSGAVVAADGPSKDTGKNELETLQGTWVVVYGEAGGQKRPDAEIKGSKVVVKGNKMSFYSQTGKRESIFELDPAKTPKQIIFTPLDGPRTGKQRGLYSVEKGLFRVCVNNDPDRASVPPAQFSTQPGDRQQLFELKREKP